MNKADLIEAVAAELSEPKAQAARAVEAVLANITKGLQRDGAVNVAGFGNFVKKHRAARMGRNPITKEPMEIKPSTTVNFRPATQLKSQM
ncbi:MAG TPA: HU family DNA-binding protein [Phycisphaerales bacterium]|nr:HU family DNA-binding protein [Phycisphaerales bacterium]HMP36729.1 HU family DNA-binding protein [Phycisphaerales bacterium]